MPQDLLGPSTTRREHFQTFQVLPFSFMMTLNRPTVILKEGTHLRSQGVIFYVWHKSFLDVCWIVLEPFDSLDNSSFLVMGFIMLFIFSNCRACMNVCF